MSKPLSKKSTTRAISFDDPSDGPNSISIDALDNGTTNFLVTQWHTVWHLEVVKDETGATVTRWEQGKGSRLDASAHPASMRVGPKARINMQLFSAFDKVAEAFETVREHERSTRVSLDVRCDE